MANCKLLLPEHFAPLLGYCDHKIQTMMDKRLRQYDVTPMQCRTLNFLYHQPGEVNQRSLEQFLMVQPSTVNGIVSRLEEKGLLRRESSQADGRCRLLHLTEEGMRFHDDFRAITLEMNARMERGFTPEELAELRSFLYRVAQNLSKEENKE